MKQSYSEIGKELYEKIKNGGISVEEAYTFLENEKGLDYIESFTNRDGLCEEHYSYDHQMRDGYVVFEHKGTADDINEQVIDAYSDYENEYEIFVVYDENKTDIKEFYNQWEAIEFAKDEPDAAFVERVLESNAEGAIENEIIWEKTKGISDSRRVSDGLEEGASPMFFFDCDLNLDWSANYGGSRYNAPYNDLDYESFHDEKGKELPDVGFYTYEECYDAALKRAMDFYYEGVESFADNPDIVVTGVHVQIIKLDENGDFGDYEDFFNIYPTEDNAETGKFIIN